MEGRGRRGFVRTGGLAEWLVAAALVASACGCGAAGVVDTDDPALTFAPLVQFHPREPHMPMGARWFLNRSALWFAEDQGCDDRKVAVGRRLGAQRTPVVDWLFVTGLGEGPAYRRVAYDADCGLDLDVEVHANQLSRSHERHGRDPHLRLGEGYYLDLTDWARPGPDADELDRTSAYVERRREDVDGEPGLRLTYWMLFGMSEPRGPDGEILDDRTHEGDWERVDVVLRGGDGAYEPVSVRLFDSASASGRSREFSWDSLEQAGGGEPGDADPAVDGTHPLLTAARASHALEFASARPCTACRRWRTWRALEDARRQPWYGFGGAWGELGPTSDTTGPLGPGGRQPSADAAAAAAGDEPEIAPVTTARPATAFAPLVHHHGRERAFPISAPRFIQRSTLKWKDGPCRVLANVATGRLAARKTPGDVPRLSAARLGGVATAAPYRSRALAPDCSHRRGRAYASAERTRPYDPRPRPRGLPGDSGFYLDLLSDSSDGDPSFERPGRQRVLARVPAYYERTPARVDGRLGIRLSYRLLYAGTESVSADGERVAPHEGGWERIDVLARPGRRDRQWLPIALELHKRDTRRRIPWHAVELASGADSPASTHPVVYSALKSHVPYARLGRHAVRARIDGDAVALRDDTQACRNCAQWRIWHHLRPLRDEPWHGFGGGWGSAFRSNDSSGPAGPVAQANDQGRQGSHRGALAGPQDGPAS